MIIALHGLLLPAGVNDPAKPAVTWMEVLTMIKAHPIQASVVTWCHTFHCKQATEDLILPPCPADYRTV